MFAACFAVSGTARADVVTLLPLGSVWKYLDNGTNQGTAWKEAGFDDSAWASGPARLGYQDGAVTTVSFGPDANNKYITTYFRRAFAVAEPGVYIAAAVNLVRDDGAVVYVNGVEVARSNMPAGAVTYTTLATTAVGGADETRTFSFAISPTVLVAGTNVIAVEVHQSSVTSSDLGFDLSLTGDNTSLAIGAASPVSGAIVTAAAAPVLSVTATDTQNHALNVSFYGKAAADSAFTLIQANTGVTSGVPTTATWTAATGEGTSWVWYAVVTEGARSATLTNQTLKLNTTPTAVPQSVIAGSGYPVSIRLSGTDGAGEGRFGTLADYVRVSYTDPLPGAQNGLSGANWNPDTGTLWLITNVGNGGGWSQEYTAEGALIRTVTQNGFLDTEAIAWLGGNRYAIAEENGAQRITICTIPAGTTDISINRTDVGNVTWPTLLPQSIGNFGLENMCYNPDADLLYYCAEKPVSGVWRIYSMDPDTGVSAVLCDVTNTVGGTGNLATDLSDIAYDRADGTLLALSHESNKIIRLTLGGQVVETLPITNFGQAEGLTLTPDRRRLWVAGEPRQLARFELPAQALEFAVVTPPAHGTLSGAPPSLVYVPDAGYMGADSFTFTVTDSLSVSTPGTVSISVEDPAPHLQVRTAADAVLPPVTGTIDAGFVVVGTPTDVTLRLANTGLGETLNVSSVRADGFGPGEVSVVGGPTFAVAAGGTRDVTVRITAAASGPRAGTLTIASDDADTPTHEVQLHFQGNRLPVFSGYSAGGRTNQTMLLSKGKILARVSDPDGDAVTLTLASATSAFGGSVRSEGNSIVYTPALSFVGSDQISVAFTDACGCETAGVLQMSVSGPEISAPPMALAALPGGGSQLSFIAIPGMSYQIQRSQNLTTWTVVQTVTAAANGTISWTDPADLSPVFYRLVTAP